MNSMQWVLASAALCAGLLAACDSEKQPVEKSAATAPSGAVLPKPELSSTATKSKDNLPPIQGQVDTREPAQRQDFEKKR